VTPRDRGAGETVESLDNREFFLFVGAMNPRKNLRTLVESYRQYRKQVSEPVALALAGPERDVFESEGIPHVNGVQLLGFVPEPQLTWLYRNAMGFVFPSLYEGFGLPILEAMSAGTPVVASNRGAMAEVAGDAALLVNPEHQESIVDALQQLTMDRELRDQLKTEGSSRAAEFTWERTAEETMRVYWEVTS
jgi:glycosyltransferase involved in cell wall biosynthesis